MIMIKGYIAGNGYNYKNSTDNEIREFRKLNIFVGSNNSGKSRFLRRLFSEGVDTKIIGDNYLEKIKEVYDIIYSSHRQDVFSISGLKGLLNQRDIGDFMVRYADFLKSLKTTASTTNGYQNVAGLSVNDVQLAQIVRNTLSEKGLPIEASFLPDNSYKSIYIPMLRGLRNFSKKDLSLLSTNLDKNNLGDIFLAKTISDYGFSYPDDKKEIFSGLNIYEKVKNMLLGTKTEREFISQYQNFLREKFFENKKEVTLIPKPNEEIIKVDVGDHKDREIFNVGDGIQSMIVTTLPAYENKDKKIVLFIEEPEMTMHPAMQRTLIETLLDEEQFPDLQIFVTTHSNHFLDLIYDHPDQVSIFSFKEDTNSNNNQQSFLIENITQNSNILDVLGVRNSSVFLSNSVIWVEGVTDRLFLRKVFELSGLDQKFKEDYDYAFAEFGGGNVDNFSFSSDLERVSSEVRVTSISNKNFIIMDNDNKVKDTDTKKIKRASLKEVVGKENFFDDYPEIENLIPFSVWVKILPQIVTSNMSIRLKDGFDTTKNEIKFNEDLSTKNISDLLKKFFIEPVTSEKQPKYLSFTDVTCLGKTKKEIMKRVVDNMSYQDLLEPTKEMISKIEKFILKSK